jgi:uncharacterized membrane-anchored protein YhcB (DUF1043 family)
MERQILDIIHKEVMDSRQDLRDLRKDLHGHIKDEAKSLGAIREDISDLTRDTALTQQSIKAEVDRRAKTTRNVTASVSTAGALMATFFANWLGVK